MLSVKEVARLFLVSPHTIRDWDIKDKLKPDYISPTGRRFYSEDNVKKVLAKCNCNN